MRKKTSDTISPRAGFSLVEVTLALMVVAVGILSVMSLFPAGLDQNARSIADTRMALFADDVLNGLRAFAQEDWDGLGTNDIPVAASTNWQNAQFTFCAFNAWPDVYTNKYVMDGGTIEKYALRYSLGIETNAARTIKSATLWVWNGEYGVTNNPTIFYTEFFNPGAGGL